MHTSSRQAGATVGGACEPSTTVGDPPPANGAHTPVPPGSDPILMAPPAEQEDDAALLARLQHDAFQYFESESAEFLDGLFPDSTKPDSPSSIASIGFALASYTVAAERGFVSRDRAVRAVLATLRLFAASPQGPERDASGYRGFYYHFLDRTSGRRTWKCELSSIDTALLIAGALVAGQYFTASDGDEREIRDLADTLYRRVEWDWMRGSNRGAPRTTIGMGWTPERGFLASHWRGYNEGLLLYVLALGSPTHAIGPAGYAAMTEDYRWRRLYGHDLLYAGPLFIHQMPHSFIDFRGIRDAFMTQHDSDYFENSRRATLVQREYATRNPRGFAEYGPNCWGITASDGPGPTTRRIGGKPIRFFGYWGRGAPFGPDDGSIAPWAVAASLPFAPDIVMPAIRYCSQFRTGERHRYGFHSTVNPTFPATDGSPRGWVSPDNYGLSQGPIVLMIENYRSGLIWRLLRNCPYIVTGLQRAGFTGGWLDDVPARRGAAP
jgi:hypothetical protein